VRRIGTSYPEEGARGLGPPFRAPVKLGITRTPGFRRGLVHAVGEPERPGWYATDNGFSSLAAMDDAQRPVRDAAVGVLGNAGGAVLDLGCGNGALLAKITRSAPDLVPFGIDIDPMRIAHARELQPEFADNFVAGDLFEETPWRDGRRYALAIVMPGRFLEVDPGRAERLRARLRQHCDRVLVYAYGDWLGEHESLAALADRAGLTAQPGAGGLAALATIADPLPEEARP
jgi:SAM-dependent methyltransferase